MARLSATSSAHASNGHPPAPAGGGTSSPERTTLTETLQEHAQEAIPDAAVAATTKPTALPFDPSLLPRGSRSLSLIGIQAFGLGLALAGCVSLTAQLAWDGRAMWRLPAFFACLSVFHFLEFLTTATCNAPAARASSFLLYSNGVAYNIAHALAAVEIVLSNAFFPISSSSSAAAAGATNRTFLVGGGAAVAIGLALVLLGQATRSAAMITAGTNFNHVPAKSRREGHELVTGGVYARLRHPSYFGFMCWAIGTQVLVGNRVCLVGYVFVLWKFFDRRIKAEEKLLVQFFGEDYEAYRRRTGTGIPFIK